MKSVKVLIVGMLLLLTTGVMAQLSVNVNVGGPPAWAQAAPVDVQFYYLPDIEVYYDAPAQRYIHFNNGAWIHSVNLPNRYREYDLYQSHPVYLIDYIGKKPCAHYKQHKVKYKGNGNWKGNNGKFKQKGKKGGHGKGHRKK